MAGKGLEKVAKQATDSVVEDPKRLAIAGAALAAIPLVTQRLSKVGHKAKSQVVDSAKSQVVDTVKKATPDSPGELLGGGTGLLKGMFNGSDDDSDDSAEGRAAAGYGSGRRMPVQQGIDTWRRLDGCPDVGAATAGPVIAMTLWAPCRRSTEVRLVAIAGVGHVWPKAPYDATAEIWRFFAAHPKG